MPHRKERNSEKAGECQALSVQVPLLKGVCSHQIQTPVVDLCKLGFSHPPQNDTEGKKNITE